MILGASFYLKILLLTTFVWILTAVNEETAATDCDSFDEFKKIVNKTYLHKYDEQRGKIAFEQNLNFVKTHNQLFKNGTSKYRLSTNVMADLNTDTYLKKFLRLLRSKRLPEQDLDSEIVGSPLLSEVPEAVDWRDKGFITPPENQKTCGACYAFSIAESIAGQVFKRTGRILRLSPQQIVDCSGSHGNQGCTGGSLRNTLRYLRDTGGLMRDNDYRYVSKKGSCQFVSELAIVNVTSWAILPPNDEDAIAAAVAHIGPVAVSINASPKTFQLYSDGVYDDDACSSKSVNHAMLVVGYGKDFWILKNWWGELWGEKGYMRIRKGTNLCGIANYAAYSIV